MLSNVFTKTIRDNWMGFAIAAVSLGLMLLFTMSIFHNIDLSFYSQMPEVLRSMLGIPPGADIGGLAIGELLGAYGAWVMAGLAIAAGSASIAGEEGRGTIGLLLANPKSRTYVLVSKAGSMVFLIVSGTVLLWGSAYLAALMLDVDISSMAVGALTMHLGLNAVFYGAMAMAIGAWNGSRGGAAGISAGLMFVSIFAVGLLPLVSELDWLARIFPWYYFNGSEPLINGLHWGHAGVLCAGAALLFVAALVGVNRRDLKGQGIGTTLIDRLRRNRVLHKLMNRLAGSARVSHIWVKTFSEHQGLIIITGYVMFLVMGVLIGAFYNWIPSELADVFKQFPDALLAAFGGGDMSTPEGFYQIETFGLMAPIAVMLVTIAIGARALAGEEERHTMGLLLANPVRRSKIVLEKALAMTLGAAVTGFIIFAGVWVGSLIGSLEMDAGNIASTSLLVTLLGLVFGSLALLLSAATGKSRVAIFGSIGIAVVFYIMNAFLPLSAHLAGLARWTPFYYYLRSDPLLTGMHWGHGAILAGLSVVMVALALLFFDRRDLRQTD